MIVVDTTVLVYAVGDDHALRDPCREVVQRVGQGRLAATTTPEVIQEFAHVRSRRRSREETSELAGTYARLFAPLAVVDAEDLDAGLALFAAALGVGAFDAVLAACAQRRGSQAVISADAGFGDIAEIVHLSPTEPGFVQRLDELQP